MYGLSPWLNTFVMLENTKKGSWPVAPSLSASYIIEINVHHVYLAVCVIGRWNNLPTTIASRHDTF